MMGYEAAGCRLTAVCAHYRDSLFTASNLNPCIVMNVDCDGGGPIPKSHPYNTFDTCQWNRLQPCDGGQNVLFGCNYISTPYIFTYMYHTSNLRFLLPFALIRFNINLISILVEIKQAMVQVLTI